MTEWGPGNPEFDELSKLYEEIFADGFFVKELVTAAVGDLRDIEALSEESGKSQEEVLDALGLGGLIDLTAGPGEGETRADCVRDAWNEARKAREKGDYFPRLAKAREKAGLPVSETKRMGTF